MIALAAAHHAASGGNGGLGIVVLAVAAWLVGAHALGTKDKHDWKQRGGWFDSVRRKK